MSSAKNSSAFARRRRVIIESDTSSDESDDKFMLPSRKVGENGASVPDGDDSFLDSSNDSLEYHLQSLRITQQASDGEKEELLDETEKEEEEEVQLIPCSPDSLENTPEQSEVDEDSSDDDELGEDSAWSLDRQSNEYFLSSQKISNIQWPELRVPESLFRQLFWHQKVAVQWMATLHDNGIGGILGDDMGMGKTYMLLTYLGGLMRGKTIKNSLVIAPLSVLRSWEKEAAKVLASCVPNVSIQVLSSDIGRNFRQQILHRALECTPTNPHLIISTYGLVRTATSDFEASDQLYWDYVALDEGHQIKNQNAETSRACRRICRPKTRRLMLTGTPILNNLKELWALFDWATSGQILGKLNSFTKDFAKPIEEARNKNASEGAMQDGQRVNKELQERLKPYFLQRLKVDFLKDKLPAKHELVIWTHISSKQRAMYNSFVTSRDSVVSSILSGDIASPLEAITWLKKLCGHPMLAEKHQDNLATQLRLRDKEEIIEQSAKLGTLVALVERLRQDGHRTLIFSRSTKMLDIIQEALDGIILARIDGSTKEKDRQRFVDEFNSEESSIEAMLLSTKAAGLGLTLIGADRVIIYDPSWTPAEDSQAVDRCYRIGQTREVLVYRLIAAGTVEEKMYEKQVHKDGIRRAVFTEGIVVQRYFDENELRKLFTLAPPGVCEVMEKVQQATAYGMQTDWVQHDFVLDHPGVVGLSRHDGFYSQATVEEKAGESTLFGGQTPGKKVLGRAQRVLQKGDKKDHALGKSALRSDDFEKTEGSDKENETTPTSLPHKNEDYDTEEVSDVDASLQPIPGQVGRSHKGAIDANENGGEYVVERSAEESTQSIFVHVDADLSKGKYLRALKFLLDILESSYHDLGNEDKMEVHKRVVLAASPLRLLDNEEQ